MSFKREGDDRSQLNILKKRRVADLLSNYITEDEAALMKNGRYSCLVCSYRPVFDTIDMLTVHRKGKRHLEALQKFYGKKTQLRNEIVKRQHENYVQSEQNLQEPSSSAPLLAQTRKLTHHALLKSVPYNSRHQKNRYGTVTSPKTRYGTVTSPKTRYGTVTSPKTRYGTATSPKTRYGTVTSPKTRCGTVTSPKTSTKPENRHVCSSSGPTDSTNTTALEQVEACDTAKGSHCLPPKTRGCGTGSKQSQNTDGSAPVTAHRKRELEHYLKLKSDGWVQDRSGQWVKDDNVEFDSDEEEPPSLPTLTTVPSVDKHPQPTDNI
ncbi:sodium channel modifier 1-like isoform X2 [Sphaeramia orbicularis]|uniref:sodium channel modifier 1-like isoform X2 n=1 Tax=Sphaeramia orbicularis TaxID=375764 RepID=UPI0011813ED1|nr:sodium channel modifier 1-like isoform X2 [Sphaeramia orbicularis]